MQAAGLPATLSLAACLSCVPAANRSMGEAGPLAAGVAAALLLRLSCSSLAVAAAS